MQSLDQTPSITRLLELRRELSDIETMVVKFERYIEAVVIYSGHRLELARSHLAVGFEHAAQTLLAMGAIAERSYAETSQALGRTERDASTLAELLRRVPARHLGSSGDDRAPGSMPGRSGACAER